MRQVLTIVGLCVGAAILYGILHDQVTARISVEYFTIGHPPLVDSEEPTVLALAWGVVATWWVGALLGLGLAVAARAGRRPKRSARSLVRPVSVLFLVAGLSAALAGLIGRGQARAGGVFLRDPLASQMPPDRHVDFLTALWIHSASYAVGFAGGLVLMVWVWLRRGR